MDEKHGWNLATTEMRFRPNSPLRDSEFGNRAQAGRKAEKQISGLPAPARDLALPLGRGGFELPVPLVQSDLLAGILICLGAQAGFASSSQQARAQVLQRPFVAQMELAPNQSFLPSCARDFQPTN